MSRTFAFPPPGYVKVTSAKVIPDEELLPKNDTQVDVSEKKERKRKERESEINLEVSDKREEKRHKKHKDKKEKSKDKDGKEKHKDKDRKDKHKDKKKSKDDKERISGKDKRENSKDKEVSVSTASGSVASLKIKLKSSKSTDTAKQGEELKAAEQGDNSKDSVITKVDLADSADKPAGNHRQTSHGHSKVNAHTPSRDSSKKIYKKSNDIDEKTSKNGSVVNSERINRVTAPEERYTDNGRTSSYQSERINRVTASDEKYTDNGRSSSYQSLNATSKLHVSNGKCYGSADTSSHSEGRTKISQSFNRDLPQLTESKPGIPVTKLSNGNESKTNQNLTTLDKTVVGKKTNQNLTTLDKTVVGKKIQIPKGQSTSSTQANEQPKSISSAERTKHSTPVTSSQHARQEASNAIVKAEGVQLQKELTKPEIRSAPNSSLPSHLHKKENQNELHRKEAQHDKQLGFKSSSSVHSTGKDGSSKIVLPGKKSNQERDQKTSPLKVKKEVHKSATIKGSSLNRSKLTEDKELSSRHQSLPPKHQGISTKREREPEASVPSTSGQDGRAAVKRESPNKKSKVAPKELQGKINGKPQNVEKAVKTEKPQVDVKQNTVSSIVKCSTSISTNLAGPEGTEPSKLQRAEGLKDSKSEENSVSDSDEPSTSDDYGYFDFGSLPLPVMQPIPEDNMEWLFRKKPEPAVKSDPKFEPAVKSDPKSQPVEEVKKVWDEAVFIPSAGIYALPFVVPF